MPSDRDIIQRIRNGDATAFKVLFDQYQSPIFNLCCRIVGNRNEAEDLCQDVFFKIYKSLNTFKYRSKLSTWIYRITVNLALNHLRNRKKTSRIPLEGFDHAQSGEVGDLLLEGSTRQPDTALEKKELESMIRRALDCLPEKQRIALVLQKYEGLSCKEIAAVMDCTLSSVQSRLFRGKENLYRILLPYMDHL